MYPSMYNQPRTSCTSHGGGKSARQALRAARTVETESTVVHHKLMDGDAKVALCTRLDPGICNARPVQSVEDIQFQVGDPKVQAVLEWLASCYIYRALV